MTTPYRLLDLFSGIGGYSLGLERSGLCKTVAFCEIEKFPRQILRRHWPDVPIYEDVRTLTAERLSRDGIGIDAICGGFPCQDISTAGRGAGLAGDRSGLWSEYSRLIGELRPRYVFVENVGALLFRGIDRVLGDLATLGYDAEWQIISAADVGAPHLRERVWIVAYSDNRRRRADVARWNDTHRNDSGRKEKNGFDGTVYGACSEREMAYASDASSVGYEIGENDAGTSRKTTQPEGRSANGILASDDVANTASERFGETWKFRYPQSEEWIAGGYPAEWSVPWPEKLSQIQGMDDGISSRLDKLGIDTTGNAVVPQIPELIGRTILEWEAQDAEARTNEELVG